MKFGKLLQQTVSLSISSWAPHWIEYKILKKLLHPFVKDEKPTEHQKEFTDPVSLANLIGGDDNQMAFFVKLTSELKKVAEFYTEIEAQLASKYLSLMSMFREFLMNDNRISPSAHQPAEPARLHLMSQIVQFYMLLLQLENFAVMNLCGFGKILKKHDKLTGCITKRYYMQNMVGLQTFARYRRLLRMLNGTEMAYQHLSAQQPEGSAGTMQAEDASRLASLRELQVFALAHRAKEEAAVTDSAAAPKVELASGVKRSRGEEHSVSVAVGAGFDGVYSMSLLEETASTSKRPRHDSIATSQRVSHTSSDLELAHLLTAAATGELSSSLSPAV